MNIIWRPDENLTPEIKLFWLFSTGKSFILTKKSSLKCVKDKLFNLCAVIQDCCFIFVCFFLH